MVQYLIIVARDQPDLYEHLAEQFSGDREVEVLLDRRQRVQAHEPERRRADRQPRKGFADGLRSLGVVVTRMQQEELSR